MKFILPYITTVLLLLPFSGQLWAFDADQSFKQAVEAYEAGDFPKSAAAYETIRKEGLGSSQLYNNLGLCYYKMGHYGMAIVNFERSIRSDWGNEDAWNNLKLAQKKCDAGVLRPSSIFFIEWWEAARRSGSSTTWAIVFLAMFFLGIGSFAFRALSKEKLTRKRRLRVALLALCLSIVPFVWAWQQANYEQDSKEAIVVRKQVGLRSEPNLGSEEAMSIYEGSKMWILFEQDGWVLVMLSNGQEGWLPEQMLEKI